MNSLVYTPILKTKLGEAKAIIRLDRHVKDRIIPFFDVLALKSGLSNGNDIHEFLDKQAVNVAAAWNGRGQCYVDLRDLDPSARGCGNEHPVNIIHDKLSFNRVNAIPVVGIERDVAYKLAVRRVVSLGVDALAVRLGSEDIQLPSMLLDRIQRLVVDVGAHALPLHIFIDFGSIEHLESDIVEHRTIRALAELRLLNAARMVFSASAFVSDMGKVKRGVVKAVPRRDLMIWESLNRLAPDLHYGDYGVIHPGYFDFDPRTIKPAAKIRYTAEKEWLVVKGAKWISDTSQHQGLSRLLVHNEKFRGADCWGGDSIVSASLGRPSSPRRLEDWVTIDQNTHITHTVRQMSRVGVRAKLGV